MERASLLSLRFFGNLLEEKAMPIYELGETFVALQRIIHKAYLHSENRYEPGERLRPEERRALALCVGERRRGSDIYELYRFLTDPDGLDIAKQLVPMVMYGIGAYVATRLANSRRQSREDQFAKSIHPEVIIIADRIGNVSGTTHIEISSPAAKMEKPIKIDRATRDYVRLLSGEMQLGRTIKIAGVLTKLFTRRFAIELQIAPREYVRVEMDEDLFRKIRFSRVGDHVTVRAQEMIRFAEEGRRQRRYHAIEILQIKQED